MTARLARIFIHHPTCWIITGAALFTIWGGLIPRIRWNAIEMMVARNLLLGRGFIVAPLDPPQLWRPPLAVFLCAGVEWFQSDPLVIYRVVYAVSLTIFLIAMFYAAKALWGIAAAHLAGIFVLTSGALTFHLVSHIHGISHVAFLLAIGPALCCTLWTLRNPSPLRLFCAGVCWGITYSARWETLLYAVVTAGVLLCALYAVDQGFRSLARISAFALGFALLFVPGVIYQYWAKAHYNIWGPSAITTYYASEAWVTGTGDEDAGFAEAEHLYGTLESNHFSLARAIARNPAAMRARLAINAPRFLRLFTLRDFFDPVWLVLILGFAFDPARVRASLFPLLWLALLFLCSTSVCLFQIDPRYLTISLPCLILILCGGLTCFASGVGRIFGRGRGAVTFTCLVVLALRCGTGSYRQMMLAATNPLRGEGVRTVEFARELARHFRRTIPAGRTATLMVHPESHSGMNQTDMFLVSYFAGTAIAWPQPTLYPRDKIFSMTPKLPDYVYVPRDAQVTPENTIALFRSPGGAEYYLLQLTPPVALSSR